MGPGSPTYAVRHLKGTLTWDLVRARHRLGVALVFASAAAIAIGARLLPVYEIYKVGEDVSCPTGLDLFTDFGPALSCIPHWNNTDGGADVDTSRCFVGMERFAQWCSLLPPGHTTLGLDEHTGIVIDFATGICTVSGVSSVTLLRECNPEIHPAGSVFSVNELGEVHCPERPEDGIPLASWKMVREAAQDNDNALSNHTEGQHILSTNGKGRVEAPEEVLCLAEERQAARLRMDWAASDSIREKIEARGWSVQDTLEGQKVVRQS
jgi:hypothetical protein